MGLQHNTRTGQQGAAKKLLALLDATQVELPKDVAAAQRRHAAMEQAEPAFPTTTLDAQVEQAVQQVLKRISAPARDGRAASLGIDHATLEAAEIAENRATTERLIWSKALRLAWQRLVDVLDASEDQLVAACKARHREIATAFHTLACERIPPDFGEQQSAYALPELRDAWASAAELFAAWQKLQQALGCFELPQGFRSWSNQGLLSLVNTAVVEESGVFDVQSMSRGAVDLGVALQLCRMVDVSALWLPTLTEVAARAERLWPPAGSVYLGGTGTVYQL